MVEYYPLSATFSVSGKDIYKIKLDQPVEITGATGKKFSGYVSFISPTASESASSSITSLLGSTSGGSEVEAKAMIEQPDKSIIIGLSVDMSIKLETQRTPLLFRSSQYSTRTESRISIFMTQTQRLLRKPKSQQDFLTESIIRYFPAAR